MNNPIGARKDSAFKAISTAPSINKTPVGSSTPPLPYPTVADLSNSVGTVATVEFNGQSAYVMNQTTQPSCTGDSAGSAGGVKSGTVNGEVKPVQGSTTVYAGGDACLRHHDPCTMNGGNNPGIYVIGASPSGEDARNLTPAAVNPPVIGETPEERAWLAEHQRPAPYTAGAAAASGGDIPPFIPSVNVVAAPPTPAGDGLTVLGQTPDLTVAPTEVQFRRVYTDGQPIPNLPFTAELSTGGQQHGTTDRNGLGTLSGLPQGTTAHITYGLDPNPPQGLIRTDLDADLQRILNA